MLSFLRRVVGPGSDLQAGVGGEAGRSVDDGHDGTGPVLRPEERIHELLDEYGGRLWQQDVVAETRYSAATVSRVLGRLEENGEVRRYWKERGKVVARPDQCSDVIGGADSE